MNFLEQLKQFSDFQEALPIDSNANVPADSSEESSFGLTITREAINQAFLDHFMRYVGQQMEEIFGQERNYRLITDDIVSEGENVAKIIATYSVGKNNVETVMAHFHNLGFEILSHREGLIELAWNFNTTSNNQ